MPGEHVECRREGIGRCIGAEAVTMDGPHREAAGREARGWRDPWHALDRGRVAARLATDTERGLTSAEARARLARVGPNRVGQARETSLWRLAVSQFESLVVLLLLAAAGVAMALGEVVEGLVILAALLLNAAIGFLTEWRARRRSRACGRSSSSRPGFAVTVR